jgi:hypothetical protein
MSIAKVYKQGGGNDPLVGAGFWDDVSALGSKVVKGISDTFNPPPTESMKKLEKMSVELKAMNAKRSAMNANATQVKAKPVVAKPTVAPKNTFVATAPVMASKPMTAKAQAIRKSTSVMMEKIHDTAPPKVADAVDNGMAKMLEIEATLSEITENHMSSPEGLDDVAISGKVKSISKAQPILCRTGTKKDIAWWLIDRFDPVYKQKYIEPFFGGGAIFWQKPKSEVEVINEYNPQACDFYQRLQRGYATSPNLMPELDGYTNAMYKFGDAKWLKALYDYYCGANGRYISSTKVNIKTDSGAGQMKQIDRIARIILPWLKENPVVIKKVKDLFNPKTTYDVIQKSVKGGANDNLVCLYWYLLSFCNGQGGSQNIPLRDMACVANNPKSLVLMSGREDVADDDDSDDEPEDWKEGDAKPQMPIKKSSDPHNKLDLAGNGGWYVKRIKGVKIYNGDALAVCPKEDSPNAFFMLDPPYEAGGGYGIGATVVKGGAKKAKKEPKPKAEPKKAVPTQSDVKKPTEKETYNPLRADNDAKSVFPFRAFVKMCNGLKAKVMVTINGSKNILELFQGKGDVKHDKVWYACKIWVVNKASKGNQSARFEIVYANYKYKDSEDVNSKAFIDAPEYIVYSPTKTKKHTAKQITAITYSKPVLPYQDSKFVEGCVVKGKPADFILKPKNEDKPDKPPRTNPCVSSNERKPPIPEDEAPLDLNAPKKPQKPRAKKAKKGETAVVEEAPKNEIVSTAEENLDDAPDIEVGLGRHRHNELRGGYYTQSNPAHLGSRMAYAPTIVADEKPIMTGGSAYETSEW